MKPALIAEGRASSLFHLQIPVLATHIIGLMRFLKRQEEATVRGYALNPDHELPHSGNCCAGGMSLHIVVFRHL